jgi:hypothetical protein
MIDYIKILKIVLNEIKNTIKLYTDELNNNKFEPTEEHELKKPMFIHKILYNVGLITTFMPLFIIFSYWVVTDDAISNIIHNRTLILFGIPFNITIICCTTIIGIILFLTDLKIYTKTHNIICKMTAQHDKFIYESKKNIKINKTKELLKNFTGEEIDDNEIDALINYNYYGSSNIPVKGNLYEIPIKTMLQKANVKSIQNLYKNIYFLYKYYLNNYVEDNEYAWITKQLNAFYNDNITENIDSIELLKNLKN